MRDNHAHGFSAPSCNRVPGINYHLPDIGLHPHTPQEANEGLLIRRLDPKSVSIFFQPVSGEDIVTSKRNTPVAVL